MSSEDYDRYQLELILREYESRGFEVLQEAQAGLENMRFDAIAKNRESGRLVVVELINKAQSRTRASERINVLRRFSEIYPDALVDFRYIDVEVFRIRWWQETVGEDRFASIRDILNQRLPRRSASEVGRSMYFMQIWVLHTEIIRAYGHFLNDLSNGRGALEIYNELLRLKLLYPPEELIDGVDLNLFDLHEAVLAVAEGALINDYYLDSLMQHFHSIRQQVRKRLKPGRSQT